MGRGHVEPVPAGLNDGQLPGLEPTAHGPGRFHEDRPKQGTSLADDLVFEIGESARGEN